MKEENSSTTQTDSYIIHVNVSKIQYPVTVIEKNPTLWTEDGQTIEYRPQIEWAEGTTDKVEGVGNTFNAAQAYDRLVVAHIPHARQASCRLVHAANG